jgi:hypothetical protein
MKFRHSMPILRLAYTTQFLIALIAVFVLWSQVGGQSHLDLMPWYLKLALGAGAAFAVVKGTAAAVSGETAWNGRTLRWLGIVLALLLGCGLASYYYHVYGESDEDDEQDSSVVGKAVPPLLPGQPSELPQVAQSAPASPFRSDFRHHDAVALMKELPQNVLQLRGGVGAAQCPLVGQHLLGFKGPQARPEGAVIAFVEHVAGDQVELQ